MNLKKTPLYEEHLKSKGRMVPFAGYEMPVQYEGLMKEHEAVRNQVGLFDVSHMGEFLIEGKGAGNFLNHLLTNDIEKLYDGRCQYNLMCYENGTVVDDVIVSQLAEDRFLMVVNAANIEKDWQWISQHKPDDVHLKNISEDFALIAVQGPRSQELMETVLDQSLSELKYYHFQILNGQFESDVFSGAFLSRTGYTGEDGFEILIPNQAAAQLWQDLLEAGQDFGVKPAGLGARDTLRLEATYSLYGHEISDQITGLEAGLGWVIKLNKEEFIGKTALQKEKETGSKRRIKAFEMIDSGIARDHCEVYTVSDQKIGFVTSGTHSPTLKKAIGLVLISAEAEIGEEVFIDIRGKKRRALLVKKPFYKRS